MEIQWLDDFLSPSQIDLFFSQSLPEQRHALDVAYDILDKRCILNNIDYNNLLLAALFHDCGKSITKIYLWQRIFFVFFENMPTLGQKIVLKNKALANAVKIFSNHSLLGKCLAAKAGFNKEVQILILNHHSPVSPLEYLLNEADNKE